MFQNVLELLYKYISFFLLVVVDFYFKCSCALFTHHSVDFYLKIYAFDLFIVGNF